MTSKPFVEGLDFYYDDQGQMVLMAKFLLDRGTCCGNGCRHCPYGYEMVPEPQRSELNRKGKNEDSQGPV
jgi:hypothetical protein